MQHHNQEVEYTYAGFWMRFAAYAVDGIILAIGIGVIHAVLMIFMKILKDTPLGGEILFQYTLTDIVEYLIKALYFILFTYFIGGSLGKKLLNLKVISVKESEKLCLLDVIYRETVGRYLSGIILGIGYLMTGVDKEKRALHDMLCDTRVVQVKKVSVKKAVEPDRVEPVLQRVEDMIPQMVEEPANQGHSEEYVEEQWKQILERDS